MWGLFKKKKNVKTLGEVPALQVDVHSHLIPGIDDGAANLEESIEMIKTFSNMGFRKIITTPHVMEDYFKNSPEIILNGLDQLRNEVYRQGIDIRIEAAAEYYLDEFFIKKLKNEEELLTIGEEKYILFETSYMTANAFLDEAIFLMQSQGLKPIMAHPERYVYLYGNYERLKSFHERGVLLQVNALSFLGYYSKDAQKVAQQLSDDGLIAFVGSDCHKAKHLEWYQKLESDYYYQKTLKDGVLNNSL
ncbi:tyrosine-protein phosphatase [Sediminitomix flava]|uniref:protein-tyrosine-phosphatase n=1 Tax=Sediminitomix flava TaxID=379075 RepID=A0A315Z2S9_SEDFL|nr:CpsB/CapC family capsule biosynthesis tyrosine phosphatase [Sediminitomix flava]PWJ36096.1 tyrosine-protein phosphatase YwqE [Sediminitomix flava]